MSQANRQLRDVHHDVHLTESKQYSIADARRKLPSLVDEAEAGSEVQLTRRGRAVAVMVSVEEYARLKGNRVVFSEAYDAFRKRFPAAG